MKKGVMYMVYSLAVSVGTMLFCYGGPVRTVDKMVMMVCGLLIGWFWSVEIAREATQEKNGKQKRRRETKK